MRLLVIGGTAFIGKEVVRLARSRGDEVVLFNRGVTAPDSSERQITGDVARITDHTDELRAISPDAVIHCIASSGQDAANVVDVFRGSDTRVVALSSQDCYAAFHQFRGDRETSDFPITEAAPLAPPFYWRSTGSAKADTYDKNQMTDVLLSAHADGVFPATVLRLPMVYGPGDRQFEHRHGAMLHHLLDRRRTYVIGEREQGRIWTYDHVTNVAAAILHAATSDAATGQAWNIGESSIRTQRRWVELIAEVGGHTFEFHVVPDAMLPNADGAETNRPAFHILVDCNAFRRATGFVSPVDLTTGIANTIDWARAHPADIGPRPDYAGLDEAAYRFAQLLTDAANV